MKKKHPGQAHHSSPYEPASYRLSFILPLLSGIRESSWPVRFILLFFQSFMPAELLARLQCSILRTHRYSGVTRKSELARNCRASSQRSETTSVILWFISLCRHSLMATVAETVVRSLCSQQVGDALRKGDFPGVLSEPPTSVLGIMRP